MCPLPGSGIPGGLWLALRIFFGLNAVLLVYLIISDAFASTEFFAIHVSGIPKISANHRVPLVPSLVQQSTY